VLQFLQAMDQAVAQQNWYAAMALALMTPDLCAQAEKDAPTTSKDYIAWFDRWVAPRYKTTETVENPQIRAEFERRRLAAQSDADHVAARRWFLEESPISTREVTFLEGADAYALRCAFLHAGTDDISRQKARRALERFILTAPQGRSVMHNNILGDGLLQVRVDLFCKDVSAGAVEWLNCPDADRDSRLDRAAKIN
jgi:hypothetical protein